MLNIFKSGVCVYAKRHVSMMSGGTLPKRLPILRSLKPAEQIKNEMIIGEQLLNFINMDKREKESKKIIEKHY